MTNRRTYGTARDTKCTALSAAAGAQPDTAADAVRAGTDPGDTPACRAAGVHSAAQQRKASRPGTSGFTENHRADISGGVRILRLPLCERDRRGFCDHCRRQPGGHCRVGSLSGGKTGADAPHQRSELSGLSCGDRLCRAALPADMPGEAIQPPSDRRCGVGQDNNAP